MTGDDRNECEEGGRRAAPVLTIDYALYDRYLEGCDLSGDQKRRFLDAMWSIIVEFVRLGFEVHPAQQAQEACGKSPRKHTEMPSTCRDALPLDDSRKSNFRKAADVGNAEAAERIQE